MKVIVTGAHGQLGTDVVLCLKKNGHIAIGADLQDFDITDSKETGDFFTKHQPDAVIHCAAYTAVDKAESEPALCENVNVVGTANIAKAAESVGAKMVYISTDYVYNGQGIEPFTEDATPAPLNVYGRTKYKGEQKASVCSKLFIVRTSWVFGLHGANFVKTMLRLSENHDTLKVVSDQIGSPTFTEDLAKLLCHMVSSDKYGIYNATNEGYCSWNEFAKIIFEKSDKAVQVLPVTTEEYGAPAQRPKNSRLSKQKLTDNGFTKLPTWEDALNRFLKQYL